MFADDTPNFVKDDHNHLIFLYWLLMWFEAISGLKINLEKSELIPIGRVEDVELLPVELGWWVDFLLPICPWVLVINL